MAGTRVRGAAACAVAAGAALAARARPLWVVDRPHAARERAPRPFCGRARLHVTLKKYIGVAVPIYLVDYVERDVQHAGDVGEVER